MRTRSVGVAGSWRELDVISSRFVWVWFQSAVVLSADDQRPCLVEHLRHSLANQRLTIGTATRSNNFTLRQCLVSYNTNTDPVWWPALPTQERACKLQSPDGAADDT